MVDSGAEESCARPTSFPSCTPDLTRKVDLVAAEGSEITTMGEVNPQVSLRTSEGTDLAACFKLQASDVTDDILCLANIEDADCQIFFLGPLGRWIKTKDGTWIEMVRTGKRYYLHYDTDTPAAKTAEPGLVAANEAAGASSQERDDVLFDPFLGEDFEPELKERVQRQLDQEAELDAMPEITDESALERLLEVPAQQPQPKA